MVERGCGHIVNTASVAGLVPTPLCAAYSLTKHAVVGVSTSLRGEARSKGVKVSAICPGVIKTPLAQNSILLHLDREKALAEMPLAMGDVDRCAQTILRGVARNKEIIMVTGHARVMWWTYRFLPRFLTRLSARVFVDRARQDLAIRHE